MNKKRGITLVEVVVAMAIAVIISTMAFATCSFALGQNEQSKIKNFFVNQASNYINCYYLGSSQYSDAMEFLIGNNYTFGEDAQIYYTNDFKVSSEPDSPYTIKLTFKESSFLVECYSAQNLIYNIEV